MTRSSLQHDVAACRACAGVCLLCFLFSQLRHTTHRLLHLFRIRATRLAVFEALFLQKQSQVVDLVLQLAQKSIAVPKQIENFPKFAKNEKKRHTKYPGT